MHDNCPAVSLYDLRAVFEAPGGGEGSDRGVIALIEHSFPFQDLFLRKTFGATSDHRARKLTL